MENGSTYESKTLTPEQYIFRGIHPRIHMGTASDRYAGWIDQRYTRENYAGRITKRSNIVGVKSFTEELLPLNSLAEYFEHLDILEIDYTFYCLLLEKDGKESPQYEPSKTFHVLRKYSDYLKDGDGVILKAPQVIFASKLYRSGRYVENNSYLNAELFTKQFYNPAVKILGSALKGFLFEQEYHRKQDRLKAVDLASELNFFFSSIPKDKRYHLELRTESYLKASVFDVMRKYNIGQVLSHWTWLPGILKQFARAGNAFTNSEQCMIRLIKPMGMRYEAAYTKAYPFDKMVEDLLQPEIAAETVAMMKTAIGQGITMNIIINNRAGGNAPLIAREVLNQYLC